MSTFRNPVGPQSSRVYWRRRMMVGLGLLAAIVIIVLIVVQPGSGDPRTDAPKTTPAASATPKAAVQKEGAPCVASVIKLEPITDKTTYAAGEIPQISMKITNTGTVACTFNVGSTVQELKITSGTEQIWTSKDCQHDPVDTSTVLEPNVPQSTQPIPWDRTRSATETCQGDRPPVTAGGASYHLSVLVGDIKSGNTAQFILN